MRPRFIDDFFAQLRQSAPAGAALRDELTAVVRTAVAATLARMNLVTREEFDAQSALLARTREHVVSSASRAAALVDWFLADVAAVVPGPGWEGIHASW